MNTPVKFELAKLLKEKGFDESCNYIFDNGKEKYLGEIQRKNSTYKHVITRPTIAEVVMWLYEKHGIWIECLHRGDMGDFTFKISKLKKGWGTEPHYVHNNGFNLPTEAYEAAIEYTLKNLI